jgi:ribosomal protein S18 acetylase RimI-like enzyme
MSYTNIKQCTSTIPMKIKISVSPLTDNIMALHKRIFSKDHENDPTIAFELFKEQSNTIPHNIGIWWVAEEIESSILIGIYSVYTHPIGSRAFMYNFGIDPTYHRQGYGDKLLDQCIATHSTAHQKLYLYVDAANHPAINLYKKHGFKVSDVKEYEQNGLVCYVHES